MIAATIAIQGMHPALGVPIHIEDGSTRREAIEKLKGEYKRSKLDWIWEQLHAWGMEKELENQIECAKDDQCFKTLRRTIHRTTY